MIEPYSNPFATRYFRPGAIPYWFLEPNTSMETIRSRLSQASWWGQIVGPHGSGKSTLLKSLLHYWSVWQRTPILFSSCPELANLRHQLNRETKQHDRGSRIQCIVDGFDSLPFVTQWLLPMICYARGWGLLITTHKPSWQSRGLTRRNGPFPVVWQTSTDPQLAWQLVCHLTADRLDKPTKREVERAFQCASGNLREMFFRLYDRVSPNSPGLD